jgi:hypothetical protein
MEISKLRGRVSEITLCYVHPRLFLYPFSSEYSFMTKYRKIPFFFFFFYKFTSKSDVYILPPAGIGPLPCRPCNDLCQLRGSFCSWHCYLADENHEKHIPTYLRMKSLGCSNELLKTVPSLLGLIVQMSEVHGRIRRET